LRVVGCCPALLRERDPRRVGVDGCPCAVTTEVIEVGPNDRPRPWVVVERAQRRGEHLPLRLGQNPTQLFVGEEEEKPSWSPDGARIAWECTFIDKICVMDADGQNPAALTDGSAKERDPAWW